MIPNLAVFGLLASSIVLFPAITIVREVTPPRANPVMALLKSLVLSGLQALGLLPLISAC
jgi:hypothetical protein